MNENELINSKGVEGAYGPNDSAYMCYSIANALPALLQACDSFVGYSHSRPLKRNDHLVLAIEHLRQLYEENIRYANETFDPTLFEIPERLFKTHAEYWGYPEPISMTAPTGLDE